MWQKLHWAIFQTILLHLVFLPLKGSLYTSSSASLDVTWLSSVAEITEKIFQLFYWSQLSAITTNVLILAYLEDSFKPSSGNDPKNCAPELRYTWSTNSTKSRWRSLSLLLFLTCGWKLIFHLQFFSRCWEVAFCHS